MISALMMFKGQLGISSEKKDVQYLSELDAAAEEIRNKGAALDENSPSDLQLIVDYAVFVHLNADKAAELPMHIMSRIRTRQIRARAGSGEA